MNLTQDQKEFLKKNFKKYPDLMELTRIAFDNQNLDGRSKEGRAVREFLAEEGFEYKTKKYSGARDVVLTDPQKEFILEHADSMNSFKIAELLFPDSKISPLSKETRVVYDFLKLNNRVKEAESALYTEYIAPKTPAAAIMLINEYAGVTIEEEKMNMQVKNQIDSTIKFLSSPRFTYQMNSYTSVEDRNLFESEFIRSVWDKPDLTSDEINLYIMLNMEYINQKYIQTAINKLNKMFDEVDDQREMAMKLTEAIKVKTDEYDKCEKRIESLIKKLQGDRATRLKDKIQANATILSLIRAFQDKEERDRMVKIAEMQKEAAGEEADRLETMSEFKARVLGISKADVI